VFLSRRKGGFDKLSQAGIQDGEKMVKVSEALNLNPSAS